MSPFAVPVRLIHPEQRDQMMEIDLLVDTGATYSLLPPEVVARLDLQTPDAEQAILANGASVIYRIGEVRIRIGRRERTTVFYAGPPGSVALLGAVALEQFGLAVDPRYQRLIPGPPALL